jgi:hypothetical protein
MQTSLPTHGGKRHVMVPGGQLMAKNDPPSLTLRRGRQFMGKMNQGTRLQNEYSIFTTNWGQRWTAARRQRIKYVR